MARKDSYWAGYKDYRYGSAKKVTLKPVFTKEQRQSVVNQAMDVMEDWRFTPFENEGPFRHGFRAALCQDGFGWEQADHEAMVISSEVFKRCGASRPSWDEGQRQYSISEENCNWCGVEIPEEDRSGRRSARFCSSVCAKSALTHRDWETRSRDSSIGRSAFAILHREVMPTRECEYCGTDFRPFNGQGTHQRYCSFQCSRMAIRVLPDKECLTCQKTFHPRLSTRQFCSYECAIVRPIEPRECECCQRSFIPKTEQGTVCSKSCHSRLHRIRKAVSVGKQYTPAGSTFDGTCRHCRQAFMARSPKAIYCGPKCNNAAHKARKRVGNVIYLTIEVFDSWFRKAA